MNEKNENKKFNILEWFMIIMFAVSVCCVILQVVSRYVFNNSLPWCNEVCRYAFLWVVFIGAAVMLKDDKHIAIDIVLTSVPAKWRNIFLLINYLLITILLGMLTVLGIKLVISTNGSLSSALRLPINFILYLALPIGMGSGCVLMIWKIYHQFRVVIGKEEAKPYKKEVEEE